MAELITRQQALAKLAAAQASLVSDEAGIGKTSLTRAFIATLTVCARCGAAAPGSRQTL